jgi:serine/threonine protein kinase
VQQGTFSGSIGAVADCLDDDELLAFALGELAAGALERVERHLDACPACSTALAAALAAAPAGEPASLSAVTFQAGRILAGRYRILRFLARGGMGEVYEAEDLLLDLPVALKTVALSSSDEGKAAARLRREVQLARRVSHPNVCRVFDLGTDGRSLFVTMELLAGETLGQWVRRDGRLAPGEVAALLPQLLGALAAAHAAGVVHRDFKSDNVMLCQPSPDGRRRVAVMDFGLARATLPESALSTLTTEDRMLVGSVAYMAPEQVMGNAPLGPAVDIYALGVVLFELLTGRLPFLGETAIETATLRLLAPAPSPRAVVPMLAPAWEALVGRCLERDPERRFATVEEIVSPDPAG